PRGRAPASARTEAAVQSRAARTRGIAGQRDAGGLLRGGYAGNLEARHRDRRRCRVSVTAFTIAMVVGLMLAERRVSDRHERALLDRGALAPAEPGYLVMAVLYPACFVAM